METTNKFVRTIKAAPEAVWAALTQASGWRDWFCDTARVAPRRGGLVEARWNSGYEARGAITVLLPLKSLAFTWLGAGEPGETVVKIALKPVEDGTRVTLTQSGFGKGSKWAGRIEESVRAWNTALDNLESTLETGIDLRLLKQPRIGLGWETVPGEKGAAVTVVVAGGPSEASGLRVGDVIVRIGTRPVRREEDVLEVLQASHAGDQFKLALLRAGKRHTLTLTLGARALPTIPDDPAELVEQVRQAHDEAMAALRAGVAQLAEEQAAQSPAVGEWSVQEVLAHLIVCEPEDRSWAARVLIGEDGDGWIEARLPEQFAGVLAAKPTIRALLDRLERELAESRAFVAALTPEHRANKVRYRRIAAHLVDFAGHVGHHLEQVNKTVSIVRRM